MYSLITVHNCIKILVSTNLWHLSDKLISSSFLVLSLVEVPLDDNCSHGYEILCSSEGNDSTLASPYYASQPNNKQKNRK